MTKRVLILFTSAVLISAPTVPDAASPQPPSTSASLQIAVLEGEDAVNIVQQKTAVAPVVEVRDRNNQPVAGAVVRFAIRNGRATFSGARTLTVTTNAAGRAVAAGLTPTGSGALQISASAAFQGQTAAAVIAQTNVMTVAQAAAVSGAAGGAGSGGGAAGGGGAGSSGAAGGAGGTAGGGGLSATTIGIVGGAVAGGAVAAKQVLGGSSSLTHYSGPYSGTFNESFGGTCTVTVLHSGSVLVDVDVAADGSVTGTGGINGTMTNTAESAGCGSAVPLNTAQSHGCCSPDATVNGTSASVSFSGSHPGLAGTNWTYAFSGALSGTTITGTFTLTTVGTNFTTVRPFGVSLSKEQ